MSDDQTPGDAPTPIRPQIAQPSAPTAIALDPQDLLALAKHQHLAQWLQAEATRLEAALAYVRERAASIQHEVTTYVAQRYGVAGGALDLEHGLLHLTPGTDAPQGPQTPSTPGGNSQPEQGA